MQKKVRELESSGDTKKKKVQKEELIEIKI